MGAYIWLAFRGIDRSQLPEEFWEELEADEEDIAEIAAALADFMHGTSVSRKYGRKVVSSAALLDAAHAMVMWAFRVNRAARRVKIDQGIIQPGQPRRSRRSRGPQPMRPAYTLNTDRETETEANVSSPENEQETGRKFPAGIRIVNPGGA